MRSRRLGIRARVVAAFLVLLLAAEVAALVVLVQVGSARLEGDVDDDLAVPSEDLRARVEAAADDDAAPTLPELVEEHLRARPVRSDEAELVLLGGEPYAASAGAPVDLAGLDEVDRWAEITSTEVGTTHTSAGEVRWLAVPILAGDGTEPAGTLVAASFVEDRRRALRSTVVTVGTVTALVLVAAALLAWGLAGRALRPLRDLAATARSVSTGDDLDTRLAVDGRDEVADLATSFDGMMDRLQGAFDAQARFLDGAAHELRAPITIVRGHVELLDDDPERRAEDQAIVLDELDRMDRLVEELRLLARSERPDFLDLDDVDVPVLVDDVGRKAQALAERAWSVEATATGTVRGDRQRLTQALLALVDNAVRVTAPGDAVAIEADDVEGAVRLAVTDRGPGIPAEDLPTLFDRDGRSVAIRPGGTGLGLPIVAAIARAHGGSVAATSDPATGTTVSLVIPRWRP